MWNHIKDRKPVPGSTIEIHFENEILECHTAQTTVYNELNSRTFRFDQFEIWREKKAS